MYTWTRSWDPDQEVRWADELHEYEEVLVEEETEVKVEEEEVKVEEDRGGEGGAGGVRTIRPLGWVLVAGLPHLVGKSGSSAGAFDMLKTVVQTKKALSGLKTAPYSIFLSSWNRFKQQTLKITKKIKIWSILKELFFIAKKVTKS